MAKADLYAVASANSRALKLLMSCLTAEQQLEMELRGRFCITGSLGRRYCIVTSTLTGNVIRVRDQARFCAILLRAPRYDTYLAQKLLIEADERAFLRAAVPQPSVIWPPPW